MTCYFSYPVQRITLFLYIVYCTNMTSTRSTNHDKSQEYMAIFSSDRLINSVFLPFSAVNTQPRPDAIPPSCVRVSF